MKILFVNPFGIGDVLFTTPLIRPLKERGDSVYYWCNERVVDILTHNNAITAVIPLSRGDLKRILKRSPLEAFRKLVWLIRSIRKERFDLALDFSLDCRYSLLLRLLGVKRIAGFDYKGRGRFLTDRIKINGFNRRHMAEHYARLLAFIDESLSPLKETELFISQEDAGWAGSFLKSQGAGSGELIVGIAPGGGTSWGKDAFRKRWPKENFSSVARELTSRDGCRILIVGSVEESDICDFIGRSLKQDAVNACGRTTLGQLAALLKRCHLLIANDGGPLHMAAALGVRTISLFGPVDENVYGPYPGGEGHAVFSGDAACRPCYRDFRYPPCNNVVCMDSVGPAEILEAARVYLRSRKKVLR